MHTEATGWLPAVDGNSWLETSALAKPAAFNVPLLVKKISANMLNFGI
jgi:hypothetical protein